MTLLSGLRIGNAIGSGGFGTVFVGEDDAHGKVAVKRLAKKPQWFGAVWDAWKARYLAEAKYLSKAAHENVVRVHHVVASDDGETIYICMQFCPGGSLEDVYEAGPLVISGGTTRRYGCADGPCSPACTRHAPPRH
jgi:serine/threonine-protein kinase